jgi:hypothetical protein
MILSQLVTDGSDLRALAQELDVPVVAGLQHQGDLSVIPAYMVNDYKPPRGSVPTSGVAVIRGESNGNTHLLLAAGMVLFDPRQGNADPLTVGCLDVPAGSEAYLDHPEHGNSGIAPGRYVLRRKRETGDQQRTRLVID